MKQILKVLAIAGAAVGLAACGSSGGGGPAPVAVAKCAAVVGASDPVQEQLEGLSAIVGGIPTAGLAAAGLTDAVISVADAVDALAGALQSIALTRDPSQVAMAAGRVGDRLDCSLEEAADALAVLSGPLAGTPAAAAIAQALAQIDMVRDLLASNPLAGGVVSDLSVLTDPLEALTTQLAGVVATLPTGASGLPHARLVLAALEDSLSMVTVLLDEIGQLDEVGTGAALTGFYTQLANSFSALALIEAGPLGGVTAQAAAQIEAAADTVAPVVAQGVGMLLGPVFDAVRSVLGGAITAPGRFEDILLGLIASTPVNGDFAGLVGSLAGGGSVPELADLLAGVPVLGELVAEIVQSSGNPQDVLEDVLHGVPGMPSLADVLGELPGLGGLFPPSVGEIQQLVEDLLALDTGGIPVISGILEQVGGQFTLLNLDDVTGLLNDLLGGIL